MKIVVKTLKGTRFEIDVKPEDSVADVKKSVETVLGARAYPAAHQMLIHKGKVLKDETTMEATDVSEKSCISVMKSKPASTGASDPVEERISESSIQPWKEVLEMGGEGRSRGAVALALHVSKKNPENTVEIIYDGIPEQTEEPAAPAEGDPKGYYYLPEGLPDNGSLDFLRHTEQYQFLRPLVQSNPYIVKGVVEEIKKQNPPLFRMILENKADFLRLINGQPLEGEASGNQMPQPQELPHHKADILRFLNKESNEGGDGGEQTEQSEETEVKVTPEDYEAIERLEAMGFERGDVIVVFFACNRNENLAANYLLDGLYKF